jgi:hypothetical protein
LLRFTLRAVALMRFSAVSLCLELQELNDEYAEYLVHHET